MLSLGERITILRKSKGFTQKELAALLNVSDKAVSKWERGESCPDISLLPILAEIFEITIDNLMGKTETIANVPSVPSLTFSNVLFNGVANLEFVLGIILSSILCLSMFLPIAIIYNFTFFSFSLSILAFCIFKTFISSRRDRYTEIYQENATLTRLSSYTTLLCASICIALGIHYIIFTILNPLEMSMMTQRHLQLIDLSPLATAVYILCIVNILIVYHSLILLKKIKSFTFTILPSFLISIISIIIIFINWKFKLNYLLDNENTLYVKIISPILSSDFIAVGIFIALSIIILFLCKKGDFKASILQIFLSSVVILSSIYTVSIPLADSPILQKYVIAYPSNSLYTCVFIAYYIFIFTLYLKILFQYKKDLS